MVLTPSAITQLARRPPCLALSNAPGNMGHGSIHACSIVVGLGAPLHVGPGPARWRPAALAEEQKQRQAVLAAQVRGRRDQQRLSAAQQRELRFQARLPRAA